jgi:hypothetical protein
MKNKKIKKKKRKNEWVGGEGKSPLLMVVGAPGGIP